ncbi:nitrate transport protein NrtA [Leptospira fainei serovar Hurstbridge str. BUT 6]|uniref:Nitrate transport protein NrtA n=1 Tax=Leptospira fainei serovar Hurstbridge str. BUT 6 TaxID=1193011 RepID=S3UPX1_9LEPT|nr:CmpA/NrtA family ABC transporter substrate-binding protein [Leptospira fainei]EPG72451.1 nitrate transport protein NrtA [Leptospira fainei serovar Hurstbridge str. BUT 6]
MRRRIEYIAFMIGMIAYSVNIPGIFAEGKLETTKAKIGYIALMDSAPLVIAAEKGLFKKYGMNEVEVVKQASWGTTRDNLELGSENGGIDGAHILTPMPYALALGINTKGNKPVPMYILARLNLNNQGISAATKYKDIGLSVDSSPLKAVAMRAKADGKPLTVAMTFPTGTHNYWLRYWLAAGGIDPDLDVTTIVVPPPQMVANMKVETMDAFCVGEPWNQQLLNQKVGYTALMTQEIWKDHPEKSFAMRKDWVDKNPNSAKAILKAVMEAQIWAEKAENVKEMAKILSQKNWVNVPEADILPRLKGEFVYGDGRDMTNKIPKMKYWSSNASFPYKSHDKWFLAETRRWGFLPNGVDYDKVVNQVNRADIWKECASEIGQKKAIPKSDSRGIETFFDGVKFDPNDPEGYLNKLAIKNIDGKKTSHGKK